MSDLPFIVFDVNETLLDLETMAPTFERIFGDRAAMRLLFANLILYSAGAHRGRTICAVHGYRRRGMKMLADTRGIMIKGAEKKELTENFSTMPPHREVLRRAAQAL